MSTTQAKEYSATYLPFFIGIDKSSSQDEPAGDGKTRMDMLNELFPKITGICIEHPTLADKLRLSVISFNDSAEVVTELSDIDDFEQTPNFVPSGSTNYGAFFTCVKNEIAKAVPKLKSSEDIGVYRPTVFFFTDGEPNDNEALRKEAWNALTDPAFKYHPNFFTFGVGEADREIIKEFQSGHGQAFIQKDGSNIADAIKEILELLVHSIVSSATDPNQDSGGQIVINPDDIDALDSIELID